tara:strand:- start:45 stop:368 length:324 start_codon:yes stop_codon:yes gene_type:complete
MPAIINAFNIVPIPGFCFNGIHIIKTITLIIKVITPIEYFTFKEIPWARTLHGEAPLKETISKPSPNPKSVKPKHKKKKVEIFGLKLNGYFELHLVLGIFLMDKNII